jgi:hypothetical protein
MRVVLCGLLMAVMASFGLASSSGCAAKKTVTHVYDDQPPPRDAEVTVRHERTEVYRDR